MDFISFSNDELEAAESVAIGSKIRNKQTGEICIVKGADNQSSCSLKQKNPPRLGFVSSKDGSAYLVTVDGKFMNNHWEVV